MPLYNVMKRGMKLPSIGKIRKGIQTPVIDQATGQPKRKNGEIVMRPKELPHWVFNIDPQQREEVMGVLEKAYGTKEIKELNVYLAKPDAFSNWSAWMKAYNSNQVVAVSDERVVTYLFDVDTDETLIKDGVVIAHTKNPESAAGKLVNKISIGDTLAYDPTMIVAVSKTSGRPITFKAEGLLNVVIYELHRLVELTVITGGYWYDIPGIHTTIDILESITQATGRGANTIPLRLRRVEREHKYTDENGAKKKKVSYDIELEIRADIVAGLLETYEQSPFALKLNQPRSGPTLPELSGPEPEEDFSEHTGANVPVVVGEADEMIDPLDDTSVKWAAYQWNIGETKARAQIAGSNNFYNPMLKSTFKSLVMEGVKK